ncbi:MAG: bifunctional oligoribonuclease/PAP phosphatase NrnA [Pirellulales bacterium]|nr:bifunctional oligoribonuclease/PAP phosphatase NrnA [Pirellulales bacterium]
MDWPRLTEIIRDHRRFLLTTHVRPDCDALGSTLALEAILRQLGKQADIVVGYQVPPNLRWIDPDRRIRRHGVDILDDEIDAAEVLVVLDTSAWAQLGHVESILRDTKARKIVLDHHLGGDDLGAECFKDPDMEATGRIVAELAGHLNIPLTAEMATALFAAVSTDTGWFRFPSTTPGTYRLAAELVAAGASPSRIYADLYENESLARLHLIGRALGRAETKLDGRLIHTHLTNDDFRECGALPTDSEDVVNLTLAVGRTEGAVILVEQPEGGFKVSFRGRCKMNCAEVAAQFGGGGHAAAAGAMLGEPLETARRRVLDAVVAAME